MVKDNFDIKGISRELQTKITEKSAEFIERELKQKARTASRRTKIIRSHGHQYTYSKWQNTGQLANNIRITKAGEKRIVNDGTRAGYTSGYHGLYFLKEKKGLSEVKSVLKRSSDFVQGMKLDI